MTLLNIHIFIVADEVRLVRTKYSILTVLLRSELGKYFIIFKNELLLRLRSTVIASDLWSNFPERR